jgi:putative transposase
MIYAQSMSTRVTRTRSRARQRNLSFHPRGGKRDGAGRPKTRPGSWVPHRRRRRIVRTHPLHVTVRMVSGAPRLRRFDSYREIRRALLGARRTGFRICQFSVQGNHIHLIVEADDRLRLARGMQSFGIRAAKRINRVARRKGRLWNDRYHHVALETPSQVRAALGYVLRNWEKHGQDGGAGGLDPFSSARTFVAHPDPRPPPTGDPPPGHACVASPRTWLLREGWRRGRKVASFGRC